MKRIVIYRHPRCVRCARFARLHHALDVFDRIDDSTATPPTGSLRRGEIVVEDLATHEIARGAGALALVLRQNPLYFPFRALLWISPLRRWIDRELRGGREQNQPAG